MLKRYSLFLSLTTLLFLAFSQEALSGAYTIGTDSSCGASSSSITISPLNVTQNLGADLSAPTMQSMQVVTPWVTGSGALVKGESDCSDYDFVWRGKSVWIAKDNAIATGYNISVDGQSYPIYKTNLDEFGFIIKTTEVGEGKTITEIPASTPVQMWGEDIPYAWNADKIKTVSIQSKIRFVSLKKVQPGTYSINTQTVADLFMVNDKNDSGPSDLRMFSVPVQYNGFNITLSTSTCAISAQTTNQTVVMPTLGIDVFTGIGSTAGSANFTMSLACDAGVAAYATLTDANDNSNRSDILSLSPVSTANGVGIQIFANNESIPKKFGPQSGEIGVENQWHVGGNSTSGKASYNIPFTAQYIQTQPVVTSGQISAQMIATFTYQ